MASLRSSRAALIEHIEGTSEAKKHMKLAGFKRQRSSGHMLDILAKIAGQAPGNKLSIPLPQWLTDAQAHRQACERDRGIYARILRLVARMSGTREQRKAELLVSLLDKHALVLAFDSRPITLSYLADSIAAHAQVQTIIATGDPSSKRQLLLQTFAPGSAATGVIGLCSDSLAKV